MLISPVAVKKASRISLRHRLSLTLALRGGKRAGVRIPKRKDRTPSPNANNI
ncbi:hypothetical protein COCHEDRAFT_1022244, partial [Bipolaris maydis C5]